jgi:hypothetical protein
MRGSLFSFREIGFEREKRVGNVPTQDIKVFFFSKEDVP